MHGALHRAAAHSGLELAGQVREGGIADVARVRPVDLRRGVDELGRVDPGQRAAEDHPRGVAACLHAGQAHRFQRFPDRRDVLDPDPVQLDVLPVGDVRGTPRVPAGDVGDGGQPGMIKLAAVDPDPHHEVAVVQLGRLQQRRLPAVDAGPPLGVQAPPAEPAAQVRRVDRVEAVPGVDVDDPLADIEPVVVALAFLVGVEGLAVAKGPLALAALAAGAGRRRAARGSRCRGHRGSGVLGTDGCVRRAGGDRHARRPFGSGACAGIRRRVTQEAVLAWRNPAAGGLGWRSRRTPSRISPSGGERRSGQRPAPGIALRIRRKSTCRRATSSGSACVTADAGQLSLALAQGSGTAACGLAALTTVRTTSAVTHNDNRTVNAPIPR